MTRAAIRYNVKYPTGVDPASQRPLEMSQEDLSAEIRFWLNGRLPKKTIDKLVKQPRIREFFSKLFEQYSKDDVLEIEIKEEMGNIIVSAKLKVKQFICEYIPSQDAFMAHEECKVSDRLYAERSLRIDRAYIARLQARDKGVANLLKPTDTKPLTNNVPAAKPKKEDTTDIEPLLPSVLTAEQVRNLLTMNEAFPEYKIDPKKSATAFEKHLQAIAEKGNRRDTCGPEGCHCDEPPCVPCPLAHYEAVGKTALDWWNDFKVGINIIHDVGLMHYYIYEWLNLAELSVLKGYCETESPNSTWQISYVCNSVTKDDVNDIVAWRKTRRAFGIMTRDDLFELSL